MEKGSGSKHAEYERLFANKLFLLAFVFILFLISCYLSGTDRKLRLVYYSEKDLDVNHRVQEEDFYRCLESVRGSYGKAGPKGLYITRKVAAGTKLNPGVNLSHAPGRINDVPVLLPVQLNEGLAALLKTGDEIALGDGSSIYPGGTFGKVGFRVEGIDSGDGKKIVLLYVREGRLSDSLLLKSQNGKLVPIILNRTKEGS